jgi:hypothetical protein
VGSQQAGERAATLMSLIESAKLNGHECLSLKNKLSPFAMCRKLLINATQSAYAEWQRLRSAAAAPA